MNHILNTALAAAFAFGLTFGTIGVLVTVPAAHAEVPVAHNLPEIA